MNNSYIIVYFLHGQKYEGEIYIIADNTLKQGFACYADPRYNYELDVKKIPIMMEKPINHKEKKYKTLDIFSYI